MGQRRESLKRNILMMIMRSRNAPRYCEKAQMPANNAIDSDACNYGKGGNTLTVPIQVLARRSSRSATDSDSKSVGNSGPRKECSNIDCTLTTARRRPSISQSTAVSTPHLEQIIHCAVPWPNL